MAGICITDTLLSITFKYIENRPSTTICPPSFIPFLAVLGHENAASAQPQTFTCRCRVSSSPLLLLSPMLLCPTTRTLLYRKCHPNLIPGPCVVRGEMIFQCTLHHRGCGKEREGERERESWHDLPMTLCACMHAPQGSEYADARRSSHVSHVRDLVCAVRWGSRSGMARG